MRVVAAVVEGPQHTSRTLAHFRVLSIYSAPPVMSLWGIGSAQLADLGEMGGLSTGTGT